MNKKITIVISSLIIIIVLVIASFFIVRNKTNNIVSNNNQNVNKNVNGNYNVNENELSNGEIDISEWLTYRNEEYGFKYPSSFLLEEQNIKSSDYKWDDDKGGVLEGLNIHFEIEEIYGPGTWKEWAGRPTSRIGSVIYTEDIKINNNIAWKVVEEGRGFLNTFKKLNTLVEIFIPNKTEDRMIKISMSMPSDEYEDNIKIFENIIRTIEWK